MFMTAGLSETPKPSPLPAVSKESVASASNEDVAMEYAEADQKEAERKLQARLDLLQQEFTKLNKQVLIMTCSSTSGSEKSTASPVTRPHLIQASRNAWTPAPPLKTVIFSNTGMRGQMAMRVTETGKGKTVSQSEKTKSIGTSRKDFPPLN
jgi:hypothetical protein